MSIIKKIIIAFDGTQLSEGAIEFARQLNDIQPILLTGVFLPQLSYANIWKYTTAMSGPLYVSMAEEEEAELVEKNIERFKQLCIKHNIFFRVHKDLYDFALPELRKETRFADLLIVSNENFFKDLVVSNTDEYMKEAIHESECPVIIIPEKFVFPKRNIIAYDGTASSVFAMKQFAYLFPELTYNETLLVYLKDEEDIKLPDEDNLEELATQHYKDLRIMKLHTNPKENLKTWLNEEDDSILITGAFGRSVLSQMLKKSFIDKIIKDFKLPVFIAHS